MSKSTLSIIYLVGSFILVFIGLAYGASQVIAYFNTGAKRSDLLLLDTESVNDYYQPKVGWKPLNNEGRKMEDGILVKLTKDYLASYFHLQQAQRTGQVDGLHDYYTEKARDHVVSLVNYHQETNQVSRGTTISHHAQLDFYSADGTIATLTDRVISFKNIEAGNDTFTIYDTSEYQVMLLLEDNFWRIRHSVKGDFMDKPATRPNRRLHPDSIFTSNHTEFIIRGMNYYPQKYPWTAMWSNFETSALSADLQLIRQLGFNTIRVFIPYEDFGKAEVLPEKLSQFKQLLDLAHQSDLKVIVTLFDFFLGYRIEEWTLSDRHAETVVNTFKDHTALLAWDVKNEPDLDFENIGEKEVKEWLNFIMQRIRTYDPTTPITIGWSQPEAMIHLYDQVDFLSFHYYRSPEDLANILDDLPSDKPIFLGETGSHSFSNWWYPFKRSDEDQLAYYQEIGKAITNKDLHYAFWTLYDFRSIPSNVAGKWPWQKGPQKSYGLIDRNGVPKSTYQWIKNFNKSNNER